MANADNSGVPVCGPTGRGGRFRRVPWSRHMMVRFFYSHDVHVNPTYGNRQIALRLLEHLRGRFGEVQFRDFLDPEAGVAGAGDLVIGHPGPAIERIRTSASCRRILAVVPHPPWNELLSMAKRFQHLLLIGGRHWYETVCEANRDKLPPGSRQRWGNMCIELELFGRMKDRYNPPGRRRFMYVGRFDQARKNILTLIEVFGGLKDELFIVSPTLGADAQPDEVAARDALLAGKYPNIHLVPFTLNVSPEFREVVRRCDFYIHLATFDSQATSILETAAYGLVPVLTRESGFEFSYGGFFPADDVGACRERIAALQRAPAEEMQAVSLAVRERLRTDHSWNGLCGRLDEAIDDLLAEVPV